MPAPYLERGAKFSSNGFVERPEVLFAFRRGGRAAGEGERRFVEHDACRRAACDFGGGPEFGVRISFACIEFVRG